MLRKNQPENRRVQRGKAIAIAVVASEYNREYVDGMLMAVAGTLEERGGVRLKIVRVPGAFEIPVVAAALAASGEYSAVICLGVILRGETTHADNIAQAVSQALVQIQVTHGVPVVHEVLLLENKAQAEKRCLDRRYNRGREAAETALRMVQVLREIRSRARRSRKGS